MRKILFLFLLITTSIYSYPQETSNQRGSIKISGRVLDSITRQSLEFATVSVFKAESIKPVYVSTTNAKGAFALSGIKEGNYKIIVEFIGYHSFTINDLYLKNNVSLKDILLTKKTETLSHVTVTSKRELIENKIDKLVFNVDKDITSQGGVATDALKKIPMVTVDADGNVELLGNSSILFLINGRPSGIFANSVADALQSIPNSQIQSIEVITSPSAKYDASGTGGIINIVLKKTRMQGFNSNLNLAAGTRLENGSININWRHNNFGINVFGSGNAQLEALTPNGMDRITTDSTGSYRLLQTSATNFSRNGYKTGLGIDWELSKKDNITASAGLHHFAYYNNGLNDQTSLQYDLTGNEIYNLNSLRDFTNQFSMNSFESSLIYKRKFKKENQELEIAYQGSFDNNNTYYDQSQYYQSNNVLFDGSHSLNPGKENEIDLSIDYKHPLNDHFTIETGYKNIFQSIISNADVFMLNASSGNYLKDNYQSYTSNYSRVVYAGYIAATFSAFNFFEIKAGLRNEYTTSKANYSNALNVPLPDYNNFAPSFVISHPFKNKQVLKFAYSYRIERPDYRDLNPFMNLSDPHNIVTGNPNLQPEIGHNFELSFNKPFDNGSNLNILLFYQHQSPDIKPYITYYPTYKIGDSTYTDVTVSTRANISSEVRAGANISLSWIVNKKFTLRPNVMIFNRFLKNIYADPQIINSFGFRTNINATYTFNNKWIVETFGNYNLGMKWQGRQPTMYSYTFAARRQLFKSKGSIGVVIVNAFNRYIHQESLALANNLVTNSYRDMPYRSFGISFTYKFGNLKFTKSKDAENYLYAPPSEN
ncbi:MAG: TonB-dependent receptor [Bacteroidota bacterium]|nr:TonB-dependent receptor [Bacteroidota bacterium]